MILNLRRLYSQNIGKLAAMEKETLFERLARERNITVEKMRAIISARIEAEGRGDLLRWYPNL